VWSLVWVIASLALAGSTQLQLLSAEQQLRSVQRLEAETQASIAQQKHLVNSAVASRNLLAAEQRGIERMPVTEGALFLPKLDKTLQVSPQ